MLEQGETKVKSILTPLTKPFSLNTMTKYFLIFSFLFIGFSSFAKIHVEVYGGYNFLTTMSQKPLSKETIDNLNIRDSFDYITKSTFLSGPVGGLRAGYRSLGLAIGGDLSTHLWESKKHPQSIHFLAPGIFVAYNFPLLFRGYVTLIPKVIVSTAEKVTKNILFTCERSSGAKFGVSYLSLPFVSINFEYQTLAINGVHSECRQKLSHSLTAFFNLTF